MRSKTDVSIVGVALSLLFAPSGWSVTAPPEPPHYLKPKDAEPAPDAPPSSAPEPTPSTAPAPAPAPVPATDSKAKPVAKSEPKGATHDDETVKPPPRFDPTEKTDADKDIPFPADI